MPETNKQKQTQGFTLVELLVVVSIMALLAGTLILNLNTGRASRNLALAENELVSHIREAQSYALSSRTVAGATAAQYYILKFDLSKPTQYTLQAVYNASASPGLQDINTYYLPPNIRLASSTTITISQRVATPPSSQTVEGSNGCALLIFAAPYGKPFFNASCSPVSFTSPYAISSGDDYQKILNFVTNVSCSVDSAACTLSNGSVMAITLTDSGNTVSKTITINGITGGVTFN